MWGSYRLKGLMFYLGKNEGYRINYKGNGGELTKYIEFFIFDKLRSSQS
jgi:hypothetical protein